jgi:predicted PurR-regulated permease PerM
MNLISKLLVFFFIILTAIFFLNSISNILLPFIVGIIIAYFLDPAADKLEKMKFSRTGATLVILFVFITLIAIFIYAVGPVLYMQTKSLIAKLPEYIKGIDELSSPYFQDFFTKIGYTDGYNFGLLKEISEFSIKFSKSIFSNIWESSLKFLNLFTLIFITPIVTFYLLRDWDKMILQLSSLIPKKYKKEATLQFKEINRVLSGYIRGQTNVCIILGIFYAISLSIIGLNYGFLIGFFTGVFSFIPYFGVFIGMFIGVIVAIFQFNNILSILVVLSIFIIGQFIEGNFITPKLVGNKVGVHPAIIIFALLSGGSLFGFIGILFAIPAIAIIGVLMRFIIKKYLQSKYFLNK